MYDFLIFYIYIHRSYGYVAIEKYEYALEDIAKAKKICPNSVDNATVYNKWLSRGILKMDTEEYLMASKYFSKAILRFPDNKDAYCLNVISVVRSYSLAMRNVFIDEDAKREKIIKTKQFLDVSIAACCKNHREPSLYFFRGLLNFQIHNFYEALNDFNIAIQEEEEPTGQFHLARGRTYACLSIIDEALKDLTAAIDFDGTLLDAYICRGKCAYLIGDNNLAFHDF
jgi:tetratricopeptide (TPR) repeat protein